MYWEVLGWWLLPPNLEGGTCTVGSHWKITCCSNTSGQHSEEGSHASENGPVFVFPRRAEKTGAEATVTWYWGQGGVCWTPGWLLKHQGRERFFFFSSGKLLPFINLPWVKLSSCRVITVLSAFRQMWYCGVVVCWLSRRSKTSGFERYFHWFYIWLIGFFTLVL